MATYPHCRECGADLTSHEEQREGLCQHCQEVQEREGENLMGKEGGIDGLDE